MMKLSTKGQQDEDSLEKLIAKLKTSNRHLQVYPYIGENVDLEKLMDLLIDTSYPGQFFWTISFNPIFISRLLYSGFLPMTVPVLGCKNRAAVLSPKTHVERCVIPLADGIHIPRKARKRSKAFEVTIDRNFAKVAQACRAQHGSHCWFVPELEKGLRSINEMESDVKCHSIEVWKDGVLVAGEIGTTCGGVYCSLTAFSKADSAGTVQLCCLGKLLESSGFTLWDLGMCIQYKLDIGAKNIPRKEFISEVRRLREQKIKMNILSDPRQCDSLLKPTVEKQAETQLTDSRESPEKPTK
eukprot:GHVN01017871.1.p1 GENE.GHVN01017871.1~~GHVN01017871.1.p1  ORF type:complete len:298 (+),score=35.33 GHVN01017871.1:92-985(+)